MARHPRQSFATLLRYWRGALNRSQESLADAARSTQRHISRLESGHVRPSRELTERLSGALGLGVVYADHLMAAAGFAAPPHTPTQPVPALGRTLAALDPTPALLFDADGAVVMLNRGAAALLGPLAQQASIDLLAVFDDLFSRCPPSRQDAAWRQSQCRILLTLEQHITAWGLGEQAPVGQLAAAHGLPADWRVRAASDVPRPVWRFWRTMGGAELAFEALAAPVGHSGIMPLNQRGPILQIFHPLQPERFAPMVDLDARPPLLFSLG